MIETPASRVRADDLVRIHGALDVAQSVLGRFLREGVTARAKGHDDVVTDADLAVDAAIKLSLQRDDEGWLSEETADDLVRMDHERVWIVDPIDGTKEFVRGVPEWCVSVALAVDGEAVAGGILEPVSGWRIVGAVGEGCATPQGTCLVSDGPELDDLRVLASRSESARGEWDNHFEAPFEVVPTGSVALKLAYVAAGIGGATWTLRPKNEWDIAAGVALIRAAGGDVILSDATPPRFNQEQVVVPGMLACGTRRMPALRAYLGI